MSKLPQVDGVKFYGDLAERPVYRLRFNWALVFGTAFSLTVWALLLWRML